MTIGYFKNKVKVYPTPFIYKELSVEDKVNQRIPCFATPDLMNKCRKESEMIMDHDNHNNHNAFEYVLINNKYDSFGIGLTLL